jgi:hypothetical protein
MSTWDFRKESFTDVAGANTVAGLLAGNQPFSEADTLKSKRNVIATNKGWVRRTNGTGNRAGRQIDEVLVTHLGFPDVAQVYYGANTKSDGEYSTAVVMDINVVFNEPVWFNTANNAKLTLSFAGATFDANTTNGIINANNTIVFKGTPVSTGSQKVAAQSITEVAAGLVSLNVGGETANLVITGAVSNTAGSVTVA